MGDIGSDTSAQLYMLRDAYVALRRKVPEHPLLALAKLHADEGGFDWTPGYWKRFVPGSDDLTVQGFARYTAALETALATA